MERGRRSNRSTKQSSGRLAATQDRSPVAGAMLGGDIKSYFLNSPWTFLNSKTESMPRTVFSKNGNGETNTRTSGQPRKEFDNDQSVTNCLVSMDKALVWLFHNKDGFIPATRPHWGLWDGGNSVSSWELIVHVYSKPTLRLLNFGLL